MNLDINTPNYRQNFCAQTNPQKVVSVSIRVAPQISKLTAISDIEIGQNRAIARTRNGEILSTDLKNIMSSLREAVTELSWSHKYNSARGTWSKR